MSWEQWGDDSFVPNIPKKKTKTQTSTENQPEVGGKAKARKIAKSGLTSRTKGHVSARGRRSQARKDSR